MRCHCFPPFNAAAVYAAPFLPWISFPWAENVENIFERETCDSLTEISSEKGMCHRLFGDLNQLQLLSPVKFK